MAYRFMFLPLVFGLVPYATGGATEIEFINTSFENASPLYWDFDANGVANIYLVYDHERNSINRANGHWLFEVEAAKGKDVRLVLNNFDNYWNGKKASIVKDNTIAVVSSDGRNWRVVQTDKLEGNRLGLTVNMDGPTMYVARVEPYRLSDLDRLTKRIQAHSPVAVSAIGKTVEGRLLEIIRVGNPKAPCRVLLRARAHPWEAGGNWVVEGAINRLLKGDTQAKQYLSRYCLYVMPMANKDGVARGRTRFNSLGMDLNRNWDKPADRKLSPENSALEEWLKGMIDKGRRPDLVIDLHNDSGGLLHISRPNIDLERYLARMERFERLLRAHSWFTEGSTGSGYRNPGTLGEGLLERFGITACVLELNANWIAGLDDYPSGENWKLFGEQLCEVFYHYFADSQSD